MEYFVTGATGLVGSHVVDQLVADGHDVKALTRSPENAAHLPDETTVVEGDITEPASMRDPMAGVDGVFHIAAWAYVGPGDEEPARRVNVDGTRNVLELVDELDVPKAVYTSSVAVLGDTGAETVDESYRPEAPLPTVYVETKAEAHYEVVRPMMDDGVPVVAVLPGNAFGRWDKASGTFGGVFGDYLQGELPMIPCGWELPFEHAADTARSHILAMERGEPGEEYIVAGESRTLVDLFERAEAITGQPAPRAVSPTLFSILSSVMGVVERVAEPPEGMESETLAFLSDNTVRVDNSKAKEELGIEHRPLDEGLEQYLEWEQDRRGAEP